MKPFTTIYRTATPHGIVVGVSLPEPQRISNQIWSKLHAVEKKQASQYKGYRKISYVGGRIAGQFALQQLQRKRIPITMDPFGAPIVSNNVMISISHKSHIALAMVSKRRDTTIGIDIENLTPNRSSIATKILTEAELDYYNTLPDSTKWGFLVLNFSTKESIFKALAPKLQRYIDFQEAEVYPNRDYSSTIKLHLKTKEILPSGLKARYIWYDKSIITSVQATW